MEAIGRTRWVIPEGYIPPGSMVNADHALMSHEAACLLNAGGAEAHVEITLFFTDREPVGPYRVTLGARRTMHLRFNDLEDPEPLPSGTSYASVIESDVPDRGPAHSARQPRGGDRVAFDDGLARRLKSWPRSATSALSRLF